MIIGASENPERYAYLAAHRLKAQGHPIVNLGIKEGQVAGEPILAHRPELGEVHSITLYIRPDLQADWEDYILQAKPKRLIFNPGTENDVLAAIAQQAGIEVLEACTLVLLASGQY